MKTFAAILLTALFFGCPDRSQHEAALIKKVTELTETEESVFIDALLGVAAQRRVITHNCYLFSYTTIEGQTVSVGAGRVIYVRTELIIQKIIL